MLHFYSLLWQRISERMPSNQQSPVQSASRGNGETYPSKSYHRRLVTTGSLPNQIQTVLKQTADLRTVARHHRNHCLNKISTHNYTFL